MIATVPAVTGTEGGTPPSDGGAAALAGLDLAATMVPGAPLGHIGVAQRMLGGEGYHVPALDGSRTATAVHYVHRGLDLVEAIETLQADDELDAARRALAVTEAATRFQIETFGFTAEAPEIEHVHASPTEALHTLLRENGVDAPPQIDDDAGLDELPEPARTAATRMIEAFVTYQHASDAAFAAADVAGLERVAGFMEANDTAALLAHLGPTPDAAQVLRDHNLDLGPTMLARLTLFEAGLDLADALLAFQDPGAAVQACSATKWTPYYYVATATCNERITQDYLFVYDWSGDDWYDNNAGGGGLSAAALINIFGDDIYGSSTSLGAMNGAGRLGSGSLLDGTGFDRYHSAGDAANGGGWIGTGTLVDALGDDLYQAGSRLTNGGGAVGVGLLVDTGGTELYWAGGSGTNGGGWLGGGTLLDTGVLDAPDDRYLAGTTGTNGGAQLGGYGLLYDASGDESYSAGSLGTNGGGETAGVGLLIDSLGGDAYLAGSRGTNGGGATGYGNLYDGTGDDRYYAGSYGVNGGGSGANIVLDALPYGQGLLVDGTGNDLYAAGSYGVNGGGGWGGGLLADALGRDQYWGSSRGVNGGGYFGAGLLVDGTLDDLYVGVDGGVNGGGDVGVGFLSDSLGNDQYYGRDTGVNGGGAAGTGMLIDGDGNDWYQARTSATNGGGSLGAGLLLDGGGTDRYIDTLTNCWDCDYRVKQLAGVQEDLNAEDDAPSIQVIAGPYADITPNCGALDKVCYRVGIVVRVEGITVGQVLSGTQDLGLLPLTAEPLPSGAPTFGPDNDGDGVPSTILVPRSRTTVRDDGSTSTSASTPIAVPLDPNDGDPTDPIAQVTNGPHASVTPACQGLDTLCYKLGAQVTHQGVVYGHVEEGTLDANLLPTTVPDVYTGEVTLGPDDDGDGAPASITLYTQRTTVNPDGTTSTAPGEPTTIALDPDDGDPTDPAPQTTNGPHHEVTPGCQGVDTVCYRIGAEITHQGVVYGAVLEGTEDANALPATLPPTLTGEASAGPDDDGDGVPGELVLATETVTVGKDGTSSSEPAEPVLVPVDPDDGDATNPGGRPSAGATLTPGCRTDTVCASAGAGLTLLGEEPAYADERAVALAPVLDPIEAATGWRPAGIGPDGLVVRAPPTTWTVGGTSTTLGPVIIQTTDANASSSCAEGTQATTPAVTASGAGGASVGSTTVNEPGPVTTTRCALVGDLPPELLVPLEELSVGVP